VERIAWLMAGNESGGIAQSLVSIEQAMSQRGHVVGAVSLLEGNIVDLATHSGIPVAVAITHRKPLTRALTGGLHPRLVTFVTGMMAGSPSLRADLIRAVQRVFGGHRPTAVNVRSPRLMLLAGAVASQLGIPLTWHIPNFIGGRSDQRPIREYFYRWTVQRSGARPLANSQSIAEEFSFLGEVPWAYVPLEERYFDLAGPRVGLSHPVFLSIGRIAPLKGQMEIVAGFEKYCSEGGSGTLRIVGLRSGDPASEALRSRVYMSKHRERIVLVPYRPDPIPEFTSASIVLSGQTVMEPFGQVAAQALALGIPVLALGRGGPAEMVGRTEYGWHVSSFEAGRIAAGMQRAADELVSVRIRSSYVRSFARDAFGGEEFCNRYLKAIANPSQP
jgi:glycosyltransferase involved in cell wall biosynthesis